MVSFWLPPCTGHIWKSRKTTQKIWRFLVVLFRVAEWPKKTTALLPATLSFEILVCHPSKSSFFYAYNWGCHSAGVPFAEVPQDGDLQALRLSVHGRVSQAKGLVDANIRTLRTDATTRREEMSSGSLVSTSFSTDFF
jgi:hypothetical protein